MSSRFSISSRRKNAVQKILCVLSFGLCLSFSVNAAEVSAQDFSFAPTRKTNFSANNGTSGALPFNNGLLQTNYGYLNSPLFGVSRQPNGLSTFNVIDVAVADVNGDAKPDIVAVSNDDAEDGANFRLVLFAGMLDGTFAFPQSFTIAGTPTALAVGDLDNDSGLNPPAMQEIVIAMTDGVAIIDNFVVSDPLRGTLAPNGTIDFRKITNFGVPAGQQPVSVVIGRLDGNNTPDIAVAFSGGSVGVLLNDSFFNDYVVQVPFPTQGTITGPAIDSIAIFKSNVAADADLDLGVATSAGLEIFENDGSGNFSPLPATSGNAVLPAGNGPIAFVPADFNTDNRLDLNVLNKGSGTVTTYIANSGGGYGSAVTTNIGNNGNPLNPVAMVAGDFLLGSPASAPDLAIVNDTGVVNTSSIIFLQGNGTGTGTFTQSAGGIYNSSSGQPIFSPKAIAANTLRFINGSGADDFVVAEGRSVANQTSGGVVVMDKTLNYSRGAGADFVLGIPSVTDFDNGGSLDDVLLGNQSGGNGNFPPNVDLAIIRNISASSPSVEGHVLANEEFSLKNIFRDVVPTGATTFKGANGLINFAVAIVGNNPGDLSARILIAKNAGSGTFNQISQYKSLDLGAAYPTSLIAADFNNDSIEDLAFLDPLTNKVAIALNDGADFFLQPQFNETGGFVPVSMQVADVNDDDNLDVAVLNSGAVPNQTVGNQSVVSILLGQGDGRLIPTGSLLNVPNFGLSIVGGLAALDSTPIRRVVDFNNDGFPDFAVNSTRGGGQSATFNDVLPSVTLLLNRPDAPGTFNVQQPIALVDDTAPQGAQLQLDAAFGGPAVVSGRGGAFPITPGFGGIGVGGANYTLAVSDFDADGSPDLVVNGVAAAKVVGDVLPLGRASLYLVGNETAGTMRVSKPLRFPGDASNSYAFPTSPASKLPLFNAGDTFVFGLGGEYANTNNNFLPDLFHVSLDGSIWIDVNTTPILNHAPIVTIERKDLNASIGQGRKVVLTAGQSASVKVTGADVDVNDLLSFSLVTPPGGEAPPSFVTITDNGNNSATVNIAAVPTPTGSGNASFRIAVEATDANTPNTAGRPALTGRDFFTIIVKPQDGNDPGDPGTPPTDPVDPNPPGPSCTLPAKLDYVSPAVSAAILCDDSDPCTIETCSDAGGCVSTPLTGFSRASCICRRALPTSCGKEKLAKQTNSIFKAYCKILNKVEGKTSTKKGKEQLKQAGTKLKDLITATKNKQVKASKQCRSGLLSLYNDAKKRFSSAK